MFDLFHGLDLWVGLSLVLALTFVLAFEFINGFHDTANAVATVIYTKAMPPHLAVVLSGIFNFLGVLLGGVGVAYAIVHLLPVELLINVDTGRGLAMVFAMLAAAIAWNLGTWYFGIPASSSHTLIGSILGVGLANALITDLPLGDGVNWGKAIDIGLSLVASPIAGFMVAGVLLLALKRWLPLSKMHKTPEQRRAIDNKKPAMGEATSDRPMSMALPQFTPSPSGRSVMSALARPTPRIDPIKVCELDAGMPKYQVPRFQAMAAASMANTMARPRPVSTLISNSTGSRWTMA